MFKVLGLLLAGLCTLSLAIAQAPNLLSQDLEVSQFILIEKNSLQVNKCILGGIEKLLWLAADEYDLTYDLLYNLAQCESNLRHEDIWGKAGEYGIFQWKLRSWRDYNKQYGWELNILNLEDQIVLTARVLSDGDYHNWRNCFK